MTEHLSISICVPALNEEKTLKESVDDLLKTLSALVKTLEVIIVDDKSTDATSQLADCLAQGCPQVKVIHHQKRMGIGACYRDALTVAQGDYFTWFPADHENSADEFISCIPYLNEHTIVTCHHRGRDSRFVLRRGISRIYTLALNTYFHLDLKYYNGLTVFPASALRSFSLVANGFIFTAENIIKSVRRGYTIIELCAPLRKRVHGRSTAFSLASIQQGIRDITLILKENKRQAPAVCRRAL
jgi:glycosyltransferase involved in cell wall biosynthesis